MARISAHNRVFRFLIAGLFMVSAFAATAEAATCWQKYEACLDFADKMLGDCVNGNYAHDVGCATDYTITQGLCVIGADLCYARRLIGGGGGYADVIRWFFF